MIDTNQFTSLANFWSENGTAVSFYYAPPRPENLAHQKAVISAKDLARDLLRDAHDKPALRGIYQRLFERADALSVNDPTALAVFAAPKNGSAPEMWIEIDLPYLIQSQAHLGNAFTLEPLAAHAQQHSHGFILLLDRSVTRLLLLSGEEITEQTKQFGEARFPVRETGAGRKISDQRSKDDDAFHHLREVGNRLLHRLEAGDAAFVYFGCRNELWSEIEKAMPDGILQKTLGHFVCDPAHATIQEVSALVLPMIEERDARELQALADEIEGAAAGNRKGVVGPEAVANAIEMGETETILIAPHQPVPATVCTSCDHIGIGNASVCELCGQPNRIYPDLGEVIARRSGKDTFKVKPVPQGMLDPDTRGFSALLRFRADQQDTGSPDALVA